MLLQSKNNIVLCIPRVDIMTSKDVIRNAFEMLKVGNIVNVVEYVNQYNPNFKKILIFIDLDSSSENAKWMKTRLQENKDIKIVYNHVLPYWKVVEAKKNNKN